jgi:Tol biopolymer transport system component
MTLCGRAALASRGLLSHLALTGALAGCSGSGDDASLSTGAGDARLVNGGRPVSWAETPIVFRSDRESRGVGDLYLMASDGSNVRRLTVGGDFYFPEWAPAGDAIACRWVSSVDNAEVGLLPLDGGGPVALTRGEHVDLYAQPVHWSPDGQRLGFASRRDGAHKMWVTSRSGGGQAPLGLPVALARDAVWSTPDGSRIAYGGFGDAVPTAEHGSRAARDLWVAPAEGSSEPVNLTRGRVLAPAYPRWSPDGRHIAFSGFALLPDGTLEQSSGHAESGYAPPNDEIFIVDVETTELTRLTNNDRVDHAPVWSPDGQALLVTSYRDGDGDIWLLPIDAPEMARNLIDDGESSDQEDHLADWYWGLPDAAGGE